ncbi:hypothetical protein TNCV_1756021 [Trichonephila clavipes]|nr:hypothetical protein TNCV_1756021 [Trichonephila clavipes]
MSLSLLPLKTHCVGERCALNLSRAQTSSRWCGVKARRGEGGCQLRCRPLRLTMAQNYGVRHQKPSSWCDVENIHSLTRAEHRVEFVV